MNSDAKKYSLNNSKNTNDKQVKIKISQGKNLTSQDGKLHPIVYVNGKKIDYDELQNIDSNQIKSVNVYKDKQAIKIYGARGENGVVEVTLKK